MIAIHQSQFLPWLPYYYKILKSDNFVVLDDVQFQKNGVQNRNMIKTSEGAHWITVPVKAELADPINKVEVADTNIYAKLLKTIEAYYKKSHFFNEIFPHLKNIFEQRLNNLHALNKSLLKELLKKMNIDRKISFSSALKFSSKRDDLLIDIIKVFNEKEYLSGNGALEYMDFKKYKDSGIKVYTFDFQYDEYRQLWNKRVGFVPDLSAIDLLFNNFDNATDYILNNGKIKQIA